MKKRVAVAIGLVAVAGFGFAMWVMWYERPIDCAGMRVRDLL